jgi:hypothetical protein
MIHSDGPSGGIDGKRRQLRTAGSLVLQRSPVMGIRTVLTRLGILPEPFPQAVRQGNQGLLERSG